MAANADAARTTTVYNFEVEDFHSYFVGLGAAWVHNQNKPGDCGKNEDKPDEDKPDENKDDKADEDKDKDDTPAAGDLKVQKNNRLKNKGIDAEAAKEDIVGRGNGGKFNIAVGPDGKVYLVPVRKGAGPPVATDFTLEDLAEIYPL